MTVHRYAMLIQKPPKTQIEGLSKKEKFYQLRRHSAEVRHRLEEWLRGRHIGQQVKRIEPETMFNVLLIDATENIEEILKEFPESIDVGEEQGLTIETFSAAT